MPLPSQEPLQSVEVRAARRDLDLSVVLLGRNDERPRHPSKMPRPRPTDFVVAAHWAWVREKVVRASPEQTDAFWRLWDALPEADQARCHQPRYGLLGTRDGEDAFRASICFGCNNIFTWWRNELGETTESTRVFDSDSTPALELLSLIEDIARSDSG